MICMVILVQLFKNLICGGKIGTYLITSDDMKGEDEQALYTQKCHITFRNTFLIANNILGEN